VFVLNVLCVLIILLLVFDFYVHCELDEFGFNVLILVGWILFDVFDEFILLFYFDDNNNVFFVLSESYKFFYIFSIFYAFNPFP
jgi:hypothetical protein